jgi:hypothetical protein
MSKTTLARQPTKRPEPPPNTGAQQPQADSAAPTHRWLLFVHQVPAKPSNLRVRTWRRLQQLGAIAVKQAAYVLPDSPAAREDFAWLKTEIEAGGGEATVFAADTVDTWTSDELVEEFRRAREGDYAALSQAIARALKLATRTRAPRRSRRATSRIVDTFRHRLAAIEATDFFGSAGRDRVATVIAELQQALSGGAPASRGASSTDAASRERFRQRLWVTRPRPGIDRMGSAWLIRRFIDPDARFAFVEQPSHTSDTVPFDMFGVDFSHRGEWCTFETLVHTFEVGSSAVDRLAAIVHDLDLKDGKFGAPEAGAVGALVDGLQAVHSDDHTLLDHGIAMFEALYRAFERAAPRAGPRLVAPRRRKSRTSRRQR